MGWLIALAVVLLLTGVALLRRRPGRELRMNADHDRAKAQAYQQVQHTRGDIGGPFQSGP
jgi:hypothetical protein